MLLNHNIPPCYFLSRATKKDPDGMLVCPACGDFCASIVQRMDCGEIEADWISTKPMFRLLDPADSIEDIIDQELDDRLQCGAAEECPADTSAHPYDHPESTEAKLPPVPKIKIR